MAPEKISVRCCIAGGGPAGMMLGYLLARAGVKVLVLEKHGDFLRDFRGDTIHPSTLEVMHELGLLDEFLKLPHQKVDELNAQVGEMRVTIADFRHLPTRCGFIAFMPQWDFLNFLAEKAAAVSQLRFDNGSRGERPYRRVGARDRGAREYSQRHDGSARRSRRRRGRPDLDRARTGRFAGEGIRRADGCSLVSAPTNCGRSRRRPWAGSIAAGFLSRSIAATIGSAATSLPRDNLTRCAAQEFETFRAAIVQLAPYRSDSVQELRGWDDVKLLTVRVDRLIDWFRPGLLCIGDAAHAMSPVGGVGINLAIQDAVAAANVLFKPLRQGQLAIDHLRRIQKRRELPTRVTQWLQVAVQRRIIARVLGETGPLKPPLAVRLLAKVPFLRRIPARIVGLGIRPEHVSPELLRS